MTARAAAALVAVFAVVTLAGCGSTATDGACGWPPFDVSTTSVRVGQSLSFEAKEFKACREGGGSISPIVGNSSMIHVHIASAPDPNSTPTAEPLFPIVTPNWETVPWDPVRGVFTGRGTIPTIPSGFYVLLVAEGLNQRVISETFQVRP